MFKKICMGILMIGGILLCLRGLLAFDVLAWLCGGAFTIAARIGYALFGLAVLGVIAASLRKKVKQHPAES